MYRAAKGANTDEGIMSIDAIVLSYGVCNNVFENLLRIPRYGSHPNREARQATASLPAHGESQVWSAGKI